MVVMKYVNNEDRHFHTFIANRVATLRASSEPEQWSHVGTKEIPADDGSRGMKVSGIYEGQKMAARTTISVES